MRILIIEDHLVQAEGMAKLLKEWTRPAYVEVLIAGTLQGGIKLSEDTQPDITFTDLSFPDAGWRKVADSFNLMKEPVFVVSGIDDPEHEIEKYCLLKGAEDFFPKPMVDRISIVIHQIILAHTKRELKGKNNGDGE